MKKLQGQIIVLQGQVLARDKEIGVLEKELRVQRDRNDDLMKLLGQQASAIVEKDQQIAALRSALRCPAFEFKKL